MTIRVDSASRLISAPAGRIYRAFSEPGAMEFWLPPNGMSGRMLHFDFREGGAFRMQLFYTEPQGGGGKTSDDLDEIDVRLTKLEEPMAIEQEIHFVSDEPSFSGVMRMIWTLEAQDDRTLVTIRATDVPEGIHQHDHDIGLNSSLENLARFVETP